MNKPVDYTIPPDRPSPLPAWQHYYISKHAEGKIIKELEEHNAESLLVGLSIGYLFIPKDKPESEADNKFSMSHGYLVDCEDEEVRDERPESAPMTDQSSQSDEGEQKRGLGKSFISELYKEVRELILQNAPEGIGEYLVSLEVTSAHFSKPTLTCEGEKCAFCKKHRKKHILEKVNKNPNECTWECTGTDCSG